MIKIIKILFDLSFYYALSGYYLYIFTDVYPSGWGVPILVLSGGVYIALKYFRFRSSGAAGGDGGGGGGSGGDGFGDDGDDRAFLPVAVICSALPAFFLLTRPSLLQIFQYLPAWAFLCVTLVDNRVYVDRRDFTDHFAFTGKMFLIMALGLVAIKKVAGAVTGAVPYFIIYLLAGVCLMRILREEGERSRHRNIFALLVLLMGSVMLAVLEAPTLLFGAIGFLYRNVIVWIFVGAGFLFGAILYGLYLAVAWLFPTCEPPENSFELDLAGSYEEVFGEEAPAVLKGLPPWLGTAAIVLFVLVVLFIIFLILRRLLGAKREGKTEKFFKEEREGLKRRDSRRSSGLFRPSDPRLAVRWYYRKYLKEGVSRGAELEVSDTSLSVMGKYGPFFPDGDAGSLRNQYVRARYRYGGAVSKGDADEAGEAWRRLLRSVDRKGIRD